MDRDINVQISGPVQPTSLYKTVVLKGNLPFADQVSKPNTKYVIKHNFDLGGGIITFKSNCLIEFDGGSLSNGTIIGQNTILEYNHTLNIFSNITKQGTFVYNNILSADEQSLTEDENVVKIKDGGILTKHLSNNSVSGVKLNPSIVDDEDIHFTNDKQLQFKDKEYNAELYSGLGRKYLRKNIVNGVNILTQDMINQSNTIYVIQYDFILGGDITVPANCILDFQGGSIGGAYTLTANNTAINADFVKIFNTDVTLDGTWNIAEGYPEWFGARGDGVTDDSDAFNKLFNSNLTLVYSFRKTNYVICNTLYIKGLISRNLKCTLKGNGASFKPGSNLDIMFKIGSNEPTSSTTYPGQININDISVVNNNYRINTLFYIFATNFNLKNVSVIGDNNKQYFGAAIYLQRSWFNSNIEQCTIHFCEKAIVCAGQVNLLHIYKSAVLDCTYGVYTDPEILPIMISHEADDLWIDSCDFEGNNYSIYHNDYRCYPLNWKITNNHFEKNKGNEIFIPSKINETIFNINCVYIYSNLFLQFKGISIGTLSGGEVCGVCLVNNNISAVEVATISIGNGASTKNCIEYANSLTSKVTFSITDSFIEKPSGAAMIRYEKAPELPWGSGDTKGVKGDIRWRKDALFIKTDNWRYIPLWYFSSTSDIKITGTTNERPTGVSTGFMYFDTDLGYPIFRYNNIWVDATGATV